MNYLFLLLTLLLTSCATTNITSFTDPEFKGKKYKKFIVVTPNLNLEYSNLLQNKICESIKYKKASCTSSLETFPPTRLYNDEEISNVLIDNKIDAYLIVTYGGSISNSQQIGSISSETANVYGNTITAYSSTVPINSFSRSDGYSIILIDTQSKNKAWVGGAKTQAQGLANITDDVFTTSLSQEIASKLKEDGFL